MAIGVEPGAKRPRPALGEQFFLALVGADQAFVDIGVPDDPLGLGEIGGVPLGYARSLDFCKVEAGAFLDRPADQQPVRCLIGNVRRDLSAAAAMLSSRAAARFSGRGISGPPGNRGSPCAISADTECRK